MAWYAKLAVVGAVMVLWNGWLLKVSPAGRREFDWIIDSTVACVLVGVLFVIIAAAGWLAD